VQLIGAFGARIEDYDGHGLVRHLEAKLGGKGYYINAPFLVDSRETAKDLLANRGIAETLALAGHCDVALLGVGSIEPMHSSFYRAGYVALRELKSLKRQGAVGDVCGLHFDSRGKATGSAFSNRLVGISEKALRGIPVRIGVAGGEGKSAPVLGALRGRYINVLVTDEGVAKTLLEDTK
jgi:DNA-binding transcriptional regulator LsrR (DeoR family)